MCWNNFTDNAYYGGDDDFAFSSAEYVAALVTCRTLAV